MPAALITFAATAENPTGRLAPDGSLYAHLGLSRRRRPRRRRRAQLSAIYCVPQHGGLSSPDLPTAPGTRQHGGLSSPDLPTAPGIYAPARGAVIPRPISLCAGYALPGHPAVPIPFSASSSSRRAVRMSSPHLRLLRPPAR